MPNLNIEISQELMRAIRMKVAESDTSQKEFVIAVLAAAVSGRGVDGARAGHGAGGRRESDSTIGLPPSFPTKIPNPTESTTPVPDGRYPRRQSARRLSSSAVGEEKGTESAPSGAKPGKKEPDYLSMSPSEALRARREWMAKQ